MFQILDFRRVSAYKKGNVYTSRSHTSFHFSNTKQVFEGSFDRDTNVIHVFYQPVLAHYVRIRPDEWYGHISMRFELLGCYGK